MRARSHLLAIVLFACGLAHAQHPVTAEDLRWLDRITYGVTLHDIDALGRLGRRAFLDAQLTPGETAPLPSTVQPLLTQMRQIRQPLTELLAADEAVRREVRGIENPEEKKAISREANKAKATTIREASVRHLLRAVYSSRQIEEQMAWFWLNHFNVFRNKANIGYMLSDYEDALRPHLLGNFRDLLRASLTHPAMLLYLDNASSTKERPNENYARELLELHTLGVAGGYTQRDVQELARILTGVGIVPPQRRDKPQALIAGMVREGLFEFNPRRHDYGTKRLLGREVAGNGWAEIELVLDMLADHPATARHISRKLVQYFVADEPPEALVNSTAEIFSQTRGDLREVLAHVLNSAQFDASLGTKYKSSWQYVVSTLRVTHPQRPPDNLPAVLGALDRLGQPLYGRSTPDGYGLGAAEWSSPAQLAERFEFAKQMVNIATREATLEPQAVEALLSLLPVEQRNDVSSRPQTQSRALLLLSSPAFMYR